MGVGGRYFKRAGTGQQETRGAIPKGATVPCQRGRRKRALARRAGLGVRWRGVLGWPCGAGGRGRCRGRASGRIQGAIVTGRAVPYRGKAKKL